MDLTDRLLAFERCEALVYMPFPVRRPRFIGKTDQEAAWTACSAAGDWREAIELKGEERRRFFHDLFLDELGGRGGLTAGALV